MMNGHPPYQNPHPNPQLGYPPASPHPHPQPPPQYQPHGQPPYGQAPQQPQYQQPPPQPQYHQQQPQQPGYHPQGQQPPQQPHSQYAFQSQQQYATPVQGFAGGPQATYQQPPGNSQYLPPLPPRPPSFSLPPATPTGGKAGGLARIGASVAGKIQGYLAKTQQPITWPSPQQHTQGFQGVGASSPAAAQPYQQSYQAQSPPVPPVSNWQQPPPHMPSPPTWTSQAPAHPTSQAYFAVTPPTVQQYQTPSPMPQTQLPYAQLAPPHPTPQSPSQGPATSPPPIQQYQTQNQSTYSQTPPTYTTPSVHPTPLTQTQGPTDPAAPLPQQYQTQQYQTQQYQTQQYQTQQYQTQQYETQKYETQTSGKEQTPASFIAPITHTQEQAPLPVAVASHQPQPQPQPPLAYTQSYPAYAPAVTSPWGQEVYASALPPQAQPPHIPASSHSSQYQEPAPTPQEQPQQLATTQHFTNLHQTDHQVSGPVVPNPMPSPTAMQAQTTLPSQPPLAQPNPSSQVPGQLLQLQPLSPQAQSPPPVQHHEPDLPVASTQSPPFPADIELPSIASHGVQSPPTDLQATTSIATPPIQLPTTTEGTQNLPATTAPTIPVQPQGENFFQYQPYHPPQQDSSEAGVKAASPSPSHQHISQQSPTSASAAETVPAQSPVKNSPSYQTYSPPQDHPTQAAQFSSPPVLSVNQEEIKIVGETDLAPESVLAHLTSGLQNLSVSSHSVTDSAKDGQPASSSTFKPAEILVGTQNERSGPEHRPSSDAGLVCAMGIKINAETDWHIHPSAPSFFICRSCFSELDPTSTFVMSCSTIRKGAVNCYWNRPRIAYNLWPEAQRSGNFTALLAWMKRRSEQIKDCKGLGVGVSPDDGMKWFSPAQNEVPGFIACEACYEETVLATPIGSNFALNPKSMNEGATCDIPVPYIHRLLVKQSTRAADWQGFVERASTRLGLLPCPMDTPRHESEGKWWTVTGVGGSVFSICEACYADKVDGDETLEKLFEQIRLQFLPGGPPTDRAFNCDYYNNVAVEHVIQLASHRKWDLAKTRSTLVDVISKPRCAMPDGLENGSYYNFHDEVPDFGVCEACYIGLFKTHGWERHFKDQPKMIPGKAFCVFHPKLNRGSQFRNKYSQLVQGTAQFSDWEGEVRKWNPIPFCPKFHGAKNRPWWGWKDCTACEECFNQVIVGTRYEKTLPSHAHFLEEENVCCLYSPRMRGLYKEACETGDIDKFLAICSERMVIFHKTVPRILMLRLEIQMDYSMWMMQSSFAQSQRFANSISSIAGGSDTAYTSNATGNTYASYAGIEAEASQATADGMFARAQGRGRQHEMFTLADIWMKYE